MAKTLPFHTVQPGTPYAFHNNDACEIAKRVEARYWRAGDQGGQASAL
jgi:hypothetical protein